MRVPKYRRNSDGRAFIEFRSKRYYLGKHGTPASKEQYKQMIARIMAEKAEPVVSPSGPDPTMLELAEPYSVWAEGYYGKVSYEPVRTMLEQVLGLYADLPISEFGPRKILVWQQWLVNKGYSRTTCNQRLGHLKRWLKWLVSREFISADVLTAAQSVGGLRKGKTKAADPVPVKPAVIADVLATLPYLPPPVAAMIQIQYLCGMRPQDVINMRPCDIDRTGEVWLYRPSTHKNEHRDQTLTKAIPEIAQAVLEPFLDRDADANCFDPRESREWSTSKRLANSGRTTPVYPSELKRRAKQKAKSAKNRDNRNSQYRVDTYNQAIKRACVRANVPAWTPLQLRHSIATVISQQIGEQAAQRWLGHARLNTTGIYVEKQTAELINIAEQVDQLTRDHFAVSD